MKAISLRLDEDMLDEIREVSKIYNITATELIREGIIYLKKIWQLQEKRYSKFKIYKLIRGVFFVLKLKIKFIYRKKADKFFNKHQDIEEKFKKNIISDLKGNTNIDIKILKGYTNLLRMRINSYRIIYHVYKNEIIIIDVIDAGSRGQIYKNK